jgi:hypothetical protein
VSPRIESDAGEQLSGVAIYLTPQEANGLLEALDDWADEEPPDPDWNTRITDSAGRIVTVTVGQIDEARFAKRSAKPS